VLRPPGRPTTPGTVRTAAKRPGAPRPRGRA
jgi:hypothetical protein